LVLGKLASRVDQPCYPAIAPEPERERKIVYRPGTKAQSPRAQEVGWINGSSLRRERHSFTDGMTGYTSVKDQRVCAKVKAHRDGALLAVAGWHELSMRCLLLTDPSLSPSSRRPRACRPGRATRFHLSATS